MIHYLVLVLKGMVYGLTHLLPGLGGGLILIVMGIYEQFVDAVGNILVRRDKWREYLSFLIPLGIGMALGMVGLAKLIVALSTRWPVATRFFFMGLVIGTIPSVLRLHGDLRPTGRRVLAFLVGAALVVAVRLLQPSQDRALDITSLGNALYSLLVSFAAGGASVTPGLDGSTIWMVGGVYEAVTHALSQLAELEIAWATLATTGLGAVAGMIVFSKLINTAITRAPAVSYYAILGLIAGSVYGLWPRDAGSASLAISALVFAVGVVVSLFAGHGPAKSTGQPA
jgi:putative membrane protein